MDADTAKRIDTGITRLFDAEGLNEFERIGFLEVMKFQIKQAVYDRSMRWQQN